MKLSHRIRRWSWTSLLALLVGLLFFSFHYERPGLQRLAGESTPLMAAASLAMDGDWRYERQDYDRDVLTWLAEPVELHLRGVAAASTEPLDDPAPTLSFDVAPFYSVWLAPFVRWWPQRGFAIANCLALLLVSLWVGNHWQRVHGPAAPLGLGLCLGASLLLATPFVADGALFLALVVLLAMTLLATPCEGPSPRPWIAGALLAVPVCTSLGYAVLLPAALASVQRRRRVPIVLGFLIVWLAGVGLPGWSVGDWTSTSEAATFSPATGFPAVDFEAGARGGKIDAQAADPAVQDIPRAGWDVPMRFYALSDRIFGRHLGVLPYFPLLLPLVWLAARGRRRVWLAAAAVGCLATSAVHATDLEMGGALWPGGVFLPWYAALVGTLSFPASSRHLEESASGENLVRTQVDWTVTTWTGFQRIMTTRIAGTAVAVLLAGVLALTFLPTIWNSPWQVPMQLTTGATANASRSSGGALGWLADRRPFETTQDRLLSADPMRWSDSTWLSLDGKGWGESYRGRLAVPASEISTWLLATAKPLDADVLRGDAQRLLQVLNLNWDDAETAAVIQVTLRPLPGSTGRHHRPWWTTSAQWLYRLQVVPNATTVAAGRRYLYLRPADAGPSP